MLANGGLRFPRRTPSESGGGGDGALGHVYVRDTRMHFPVWATPFDAMQHVTECPRIWLSPRPIRHMETAMRAGT